MPIVYLHGVANRTSQDSYHKEWDKTKRYLKRYIAPVLNDDVDAVHIDNIYWGDLGANFAWDRSSRPASPLLGMGSDGNVSLSEQVTAYANHTEFLQYPTQKDTSDSGSTGGLISGGASDSGSGSSQNSDLRIRDLKPDEALIWLTTLIETDQSLDDNTEVIASIAMEEILHRNETWTEINACNSLKEELSLIEKLFVEQYNIEVANSNELIGQGASSFFVKIKDRVTETMDRAKSTPAFILARVLAEVRKPINEMVTLFLGDVLVYLDKRGQGDNPGPIIKRALEKLHEIQTNHATNGEPLIVVSHSMGGQIMYDLVSHFIPSSSIYGDLRIDFWCATASQVGFFEELKLFRASNIQYSKASGTNVPFPDRKHLGDWWNVWDHNDFISFQSKGIFSDEVMDENYNSGLSVAAAHGGYLKRPSFYRKLADKLSISKSKNWNRL